LIDENENVLECSYHPFCAFHLRPVFSQVLSFSVPCLSTFTFVRALEKRLLKRDETVPQCGHKMQHIRHTAVLVCRQRNTASELPAFERNKFVESAFFYVLKYAWNFNCKEQRE